MNCCFVLCFVHVYVLNWLSLQPHYINCSPVIECLVLPLTLLFPSSSHALSPLSLRSLKQVLLVLHFTADSTCWGSTFHIITTSDICGLQVLWLVEEPLTLEMQTANEVSAPGALRKIVNQWHLVSWAVLTHTVTADCWKHTVGHLFNESKLFRFSRGYSVTLRVTQCEAFFLCFDYPAVLLSVLY